MKAMVLRAPWELVAGEVSSPAADPQQVLVRMTHSGICGTDFKIYSGAIPVSYPRFFLVPRVGRFLHGYQLFASIFREMRREVRSFRPDVVLAYFAYPYGFAAFRFGAMFRIPVVISCRGGDVN